MDIKEEPQSDNDFESLCQVKIEENWDDNEVRFLSIFLLCFSLQYYKFKANVSYII